MNDITKSFIMENLNLIDEARWTELYANARARFSVAMHMSELTELLYECDCDMFSGEHKLTKIPTAFLFKTMRSEFRIPEHITEIGFLSFFDSNISGVVNIPVSCEKICEQAFSNCNEITELIINNPDIDVHESAFTGCYIGFITYKGTVEQFQSHRWPDEFQDDTDIICTDGQFHVKPKN